MYSRYLRDVLQGLVSLVCLFALLAAMPEVGHSDTIPTKKATHHKVLRGKHIKTRSARTVKPKHPIRRSAKSTAISHPEIKLHMPPPGNEGEEMDDWFYRRRAWPNETIDPEFYPNALAEASKMPVLSRGNGKHGTLDMFTWQGIGPYSIDGRISCIATHPTDSNTFYVGAAAGGLWKTIDHGASWRCLTDTFGMLSTGCIAIDPTQPETIYLGMGEPNQSGDSYPGNGLWKSMDGGSTWIYLGFAKSQFIAKITIDPHDHQNLFVAIPGPHTLSDSNRGVFRSTDGGATWTRSLFVRLGKLRTSNSVGFIDLAMNPLNSSEIVAYSWDHTLPPAPGFSGGESGPNTGIYRSIDTGNTWTRIDTTASYGLPNGAREKVLARGALLWTASGDRTYLYAAYTRMDTNKVTHYMLNDDFKGLYRSTDEGLTWAKVLDSTIRIPMGGIQGKDSADIMNAQGMYNLYLAANPLRPEEVYLGGIDIFRSTDFGLSFTDITNSYSNYYAKDDRRQHSDQHGLAFTAAPSGSDMIVVSDGGVFHTDNFGANWTQTIGLPITMFYTIEPFRGGMAGTPAKISASDLKVFGGTQDNGTVAHGLTSDTNYAWINAGDGTVSISHPTDSNKIITSLEGGVIFARNTLDSLVPMPIYIHDTTHDMLPRWHALSNRLLYGPNSLTDTMEACGFVAPIVLDDERPADLYTGRCHVYHAVIDWSDLENIKWYTWSPAIAGYLTKDSIWYYGDVETIAIGPRDAAGHPMLWAGGYSSAGTVVSRTVVDPARSDTTAPRWISITSSVPNSYVSDIMADRSDSLTAFLTTSSASNVPHVLRTTDGGAHWTNISGNLPVAPVSALVIDTLAEQGNPAFKNQILIVGTDVGVYVTTNGGTQWLALGNGMPHIIVGDLKIYKNMLIAATHGRSLYAMDISDLRPGSLTVEGSPSPAVGVSIYPNPVTTGSKFNVEFNTFAGSSIYSCRLIEESDGRVFGAAVEKEGDGRYSIAITNTIAPGAYIVQLLDAQDKILAFSRVSIVK